MIALFRVRAARLLGRRLRSERLQGGGTFFSTDATTFAVPAVDEDLLKSVRETAARFTKRHCEQHVAEWEAERLFPRELYSLAGQDGLLRVGYGEPHGLPGTDAHLDPRYFMAVQDEISKLGCGGISAGLFSSNIAIPPILAAGSDELIERVVPRVLNGERVASLCITEPTGGSDVANITTTATKCDGGYLLNGEKCFITSGTRADVLTVAVRTGSRKDHRGGISLVVVEAHEEEQARGLSRSKMEKTGWHCSDTAVIHFQDVFVPEKNLVGAEGQGFKAIMHNFNNERLMLTQQACTFAQCCIDEALEWSLQRETFGSALIEKQAIRHKLIDMKMEVDGAKALLSSVAQRQAALAAAGAGAGEVERRDLVAQICLAKNLATNVMERTASGSVQCLGGSGYMVGTKTERCFRESKVLQIGGGSTEIMKDLAAKQLGWI